MPTPPGATRYFRIKDKPHLELADMDGTEGVLVDATSQYMYTTLADMVSYVSSNNTVSWGQVLGTLSNQTDLQSALDAKATIGAEANFSTFGVGISSPKQTGGVQLNASGGYGFVCSVNRMHLNCNSYWDGSNWRYIGTDKAAQVVATNTGHVSFYTTNTTGSADALLSLTERMRLTSIGRLGINNTSPSVELDVTGTINASVDVTVAGVSVSLAGHSHTESDISNLTHNAVQIRGIVVSTTTPTDGQVLQYNSTSGEYEPSEIASGGGTWGSITGTLSNQTDLQNALDAKSATGHTHSQYYESGDTPEFGSHVESHRGDNDHYGFFAVHRGDGVRGAYFGYGNGTTEVDLYLDNATTLDVTGNVDISGSLVVGGSAVITEADTDFDATAYKVMVRNSNGDVWCRLFRSSYSSTNDDIAAIYTTKTIGCDYMRPSTPSQLKDALGMGTSLNDITTPGGIYLDSSEVALRSADYIQFNNTEEQNHPQSSGVFCIDLSEGFKGYFNGWGTVAMLMSPSGQQCNITESSSSPSGGANGDIWFQF